MPKVKLAWRFRKKSLSDPFEYKDCGCKYYVYDGTVVRFCERHEQEWKANHAQSDTVR